MNTPVPPEGPRPASSPARVQDLPTAASGATQPVRLTNTRGRMGRLRAVAYPTLAALVVLPLMLLGGGLAAQSGDPSGAGTGAAGSLLALLMIPLWAVTFLAYVQRAHDLNWSGWVSLLLLVPLVGLVLALIFSLKAGTPGSNRWGAPPEADPVWVKVFGLWLPLALLAVLVAGVLMLPLDKIAAGLAAEGQPTRVRPAGSGSL